MIDFFKFRTAILEAKYSSVSLLRVNKPVNFVVNPARPNKRLRSEAMAALERIASFEGPLDGNGSPYKKYWGMGDTIYEGYLSHITPEVPIEMRVLKARRVVKGKEGEIIMISTNEGRFATLVTTYEKVYNEKAFQPELFVQWWEWAAKMMWSRRLTHEDNEGKAPVYFGEEDEGRSGVSISHKDISTDWSSAMFDAARGHITKENPGPKGLEDLMDEHEVDSDDYDQYNKNGKFNYKSFFNSSEGKGLYNELVDREVYDSWDGSYTSDDLDYLETYENEKTGTKIDFYQFDFPTDNPSIWFRVNSEDDEDDIRDMNELKVLRGYDPKKTNLQKLGATLEK